MSIELPPVVQTNFSPTAEEDIKVELQTQQFEFVGRHLLATYRNCVLEKLQEAESLVDALAAAIQASGATIVDHKVHTFPGGGFTALFVLAESHASIHTYPEHSSCFLDIFTCGLECDPAAFDLAMRAYLMPQSAAARIILRGGKDERRETSFADKGRDFLPNVLPSA